jgi:hypothetical protein
MRAHTALAMAWQLREKWSRPLSTLEHPYPLQR